MTINYARFCDALRSATRLIEGTRTKRVLVIGAGISDPLDCIQSILTPIDLIVIEIDLSAVASLRSKWHHLDATIFHGDAAELSTIAPGSYDFVIIRHPNIEKLPTEWSVVFEAVVAHIRSGGLLLISAYSLSEVAALQGIMSQLEVHLHSTPALTSIPVDLQGNDHYFLLAQRPAR